MGNARAEHDAECRGQCVRERNEHDVLGTEGTRLSFTQEAEAVRARGIAREESEEGIAKV